MRELLPRWRRGHGSDFQSRFNHVQSLPIFLIVSSIVQWVGKLWATDPFIGPLAHVTDESGTRIGYHRMLIFWNFERCKLEAADFSPNQSNPTGSTGPPSHHQVLHEASSPVDTECHALCTMLPKPRTPGHPPTMPACWSGRRKSRLCDVCQFKTPVSPNNGIGGVFSQRNPPSSNLLWQPVCFFFFKTSAFRKSSVSSCS